MSGTRPITILGCLNRLWSRYVTAWIVPCWSQAFPEAHGLQHRGVEELNLAAMEAMEDGSPLGGFSLDLVKAFNQMGRPLVQKCMVHLGFPAQVAQTWITSLSHQDIRPLRNMSHQASPPLQESQKGTHCLFWQCCQCASFFTKDTIDWSNSRLLCRQLDVRGNNGATDKCFCSYVAAHAGLQVAS